jgi:hypothetical protein
LLPGFPLGAPSQQSLLIPGTSIWPPSGSWTFPHESPGGIQDVPLSQRPKESLPPSDPLQATLSPARFAPQQVAVVSQMFPAMTQPSADWQTVTPEPGSSQTPEQQPTPLVQGIPLWEQPPAPLPLGERQVPGPPLDAEQFPEQQSMLA